VSPRAVTTNNKLKWQWTTQRAGYRVLTKQTGSQQHGRRSADRQQIRMWTNIVTPHHLDPHRVVVCSNGHWVQKATVRGRRGRGHRNRGSQSEGDPLRVRVRESESEGVQSEGSSRWRPHFSTETATERGPPFTKWDAECGRAPTTKLIESTSRENGERFLIAKGLVFHSLYQIPAKQGRTKKANYISKIKKRGHRMGTGASRWFFGAKQRALRFEAISRHRSVHRIARSLCGFRIKKRPQIPF